MVARIMFRASAAWNPPTRRTRSRIAAARRFFRCTVSLSASA